MIPQARISGSTKSIICFTWLALSRHNKSILQEQIKPFIERYPMVIGRYGILERLFRDIA
jgi:hypothetical protein